MKEKRLRRELIGTVISDKMQKTVVVETKSHVSHPKYRKVMVRRAKFKAHDEKEIAGVGDVIRIRESKPLSRTKRWRVVQVISQAKVHEEVERVRPGKQSVKASKKVRAGASV